MFGESESESPRVPSPWDSLISSASVSPSPIPKGRAHTPSSLAQELIPRLVPESDDGNVEYKLQLLNPSPARFARLVTQLKWRLLEGGGQAYYELGVADSGDLVGLPREELGQTLETLEMMAGEIGASVIVVKEVEVPAALARLARRSGDRRRVLADDDGDSSSGSAFNTETDGSGHSASDVDNTDETDDLSNTIVLDPSNPSSRHSSATSLSMFSMDDGDFDDSADAIPAPKFAVDLEISSVFKPRPVRTRMQNFDSHLVVGGKAKRTKKPKHLLENGTQPEGLKDSERKAQNRRQTRDRKREEKRKALLTMAAQSVGEPANEVEVEQVVEDPAIPISAPVPVQATVIAEAEAPVSSVGKDEDITSIVDSLVTVTLDSSEDSIPEIVVVAEDQTEANDDEDDVFGLPPTTTKRSFPTFAPSTTGESHLDVDPAAVKLAGVIGSSPSSGDDEQPRLIVEALVVRKMSLEEGFLDFGGFSIL